MIIVGLFLLLTYAAEYNYYYNGCYNCIFIEWDCVLRSAIGLSRLGLGFGLYRLGLEFGLNILGLGFGLNRMG